MTQNSPDIFQLLHLDAQNEELRSSVDLYTKAKEILNQTNIALGRTIELKVFNHSSTDTYILPRNERLSTY